MSRRSLLVLITAWFIVSGPLPALAQSTGGIAGVVRDTTGAVLPGVTVEAASPALIEKVRTAVTDAQGNYKIVDLRPGVYKVTFTLPGFATFQRDGIELTSGFTATANAEMKVGSLEETVTVTGASPVVDVQNVRTQNVLSRTVLDSVPNAKTIPSFAALTLGATVGASQQDVGGNRGEAAIGLSIHGSRFNDSKLLFDGMPYNSLHSEGGGQMQIFRLNQVAVQESVLGTGGMSAESETGGVQMNHVPREGANTFSVYGNLSYANESMVGDNLSDAVRARGLTDVNPIRYIYDVGVGVGGPIMRDRLWFYSANRWWGTSEYVIGGFYNKSTSNFRYEPDLDRRAFRRANIRDNAVRLTWQAAAKHKFAFSDNFQQEDTNLGVNALTSPESTNVQLRGPSHLILATWNNPATPRLLLEAGASFGLFVNRPTRFEGVLPTDIAIVEQTTGRSWGAYFPPRSLTIGTAYGKTESSPYMQKFAVSYVTGSHALKSGVQTLYGRHFLQGEVNESLSYTFRNGVPLSLTQWASPFEGVANVKSLALFVQDQWTIRRFTLSGGARYDNYIGWTPAQTRPAGRFLQSFSFDGIDNVPNYKDATLRGGVAFDVFGNGKTAIKFSAGEYLASMGSGLALANLPSVAIGDNATRTWTDANGNFVPDCTLTNVAANGECGALTSATFGRPIRTTQFAPDILAGWNTRSNNVQMSLLLQHELRPNVGLNVGYFHTSWGNFPAQVNQALTPADFTSYCVTAPSDARLPGGGGYQVCGLYDVNPNRFGIVDNVITRASNFGDMKEAFDGLDVSVTARFGRGGYATGGVSTGRTVKDTCFQNALPQILANSWGGAFTGSDTSPATGPRVEGYCNVTPPWSANTQIKANAIYPLPWDIQTSFTFQNLPGISIGANLNATNAQIAPSLRRNLSAGATATAAVALIAPDTMFEDRMNQFDVRFTKIIRVGRSKIQGMFDIYNAFNASPVLSINQTYGPAWLRPTSILGARLFKVGAQVDW